jgi:hypothetical protein
MTYEWLKTQQLVKERLRRKQALLKWEKEFKECPNCHKEAYFEPLGNRSIDLAATLKTSYYVNVLRSQCSNCGEVFVKVIVKKNSKLVDYYYLPTFKEMNFDPNVVLNGIEKKIDNAEKENIS